MIRSKGEGEVIGYDGASDYEGAGRAKKGREVERLDENLRG
jgi:hypothetical protein